MLDVNLFKKLTALTTLYLGNNPLNCSKCELKKLKEFLRNVYDSTASCGHKRLIDHNFTNCKEITTEHREETSSVSQQQTRLIITSAESETTEAFPSFAATNNPASTTQSTSESVTTEAFTSSAATDNPASTTGSISGLINTEVLIYLSCGVGFCLILSCSMACFYVGKKYQNNQNLGINQFVNTNNRGAESDSDAQRSPTISTGRGSGYGYAEIDERQLSEFILTPPEQLHLVQDDSSSDSSDMIRSPSNDYLNPYHSLLPSLQQSGNDQDESDEYSHPDEENGAYTNLYQTIRFNRRDEL